MHHRKRLPPFTKCHFPVVKCKSRAFGSTILTSIYSHGGKRYGGLLIKLPKNRTKTGQTIRELVSVHPVSKEITQYPVYFISSVTRCEQPLCMGPFNLDKLLFLALASLFFYHFQTNVILSVYSSTSLIRLATGTGTYINIHSVLFHCVCETKRKNLHSHFIQFDIVKLVFITELLFFGRRK